MLPCRHRVHACPWPGCTRIDDEAIRVHPGGLWFSTCVSRRKSLRRLRRKVLDVQGCAMYQSGESTDASGGLWFVRACLAGNRFVVYVGKYSTYRGCARYQSDEGTAGSGPTKLCSKLEGSIYLEG
jgi:hypothetical protein